MSLWRKSKGSFSDDDGDGNENVKTAIGLLSKFAHVLRVFFLDISLPLLHDHDVKSDDDFLFLNLSAVSKKSTPGLPICLHKTYPVNWNKRDRD